jgi:hypothetical protein
MSKKLRVNVTDEQFRFLRDYADRRTAAMPPGRRTTVSKIVRQLVERLRIRFEGDK